MRTRAFVVCAFLAISCSGCGPEPSPAPKPLPLPPVPAPAPVGPTARPPAIDVPFAAPGETVLWGRVVDEQRQRVADVRVSLRSLAAGELATATTDVAGRYRLRAKLQEPGGRSLHLRAEKGDLAASWVFERERWKEADVVPVPVLTLGAASATMTFASAAEFVPGGREERSATTATVTWKIVAGERPVPPNGTRVRVSATPRADRPSAVLEGTVEDGELVVTASESDFRFGPALATLRDGSMALVPTPLKDGSLQPSGKDFSFRTPRTVDVELREADGSPVRGAFVRLESASGWPKILSPSTRTDDEGRARLRPIPGDGAHVVVSELVAGWGRTVGDVDIRGGDASIDAILPPREIVTVRVLVDGKPGLPASYGLRTGEDGYVYESDEDATRGEIRFLARPSDRKKGVWLAFGADGYFPVEVPSGPVLFPGTFPEAFVTATGEPLTATVDLVRAGTFRVRVLGAAPPPARVTFRVQRWDDEKNAWVEGEHGRWSGQLGPPDEDGVRVAALPRGRYRAFDSITKLTSPEVRIPDDARAVVELDLRGK